MYFVTLLYVLHYRHTTLLYTKLPSINLFSSLLVILINGNLFTLPDHMLFNISVLIWNILRPALEFPGHHMRVICYGKHKVSVSCYFTTKKKRQRMSNREGLIRLLIIQLLVRVSFYILQDNTARNRRKDESRRSRGDVSYCVVGACNEGV